MVAEATRGVEMRARKRKRDRDAHAGVAFPALPFDVAVFLVEKHLPDPADLAVLRAVSKGMRAAVDAPRFMNRSENSMFFATVTPSLVILGLP